jgi:hypothetical protein
MTSVLCIFTAHVKRKRPNFKVKKYLSLDPGNPYLKERISTIDLLVLTGSDQLLLILKNIIFLLCKTSYLNEKENFREPSTSVMVPCLGRKGSFTQ